MNRKGSGGVWLSGAAMDAAAESFPSDAMVADVPELWRSSALEGGPGAAVTAAETLAREFEGQLAESARLAFRVALGVLRNRAEAEDVAQETLLRAYRNFHRLREAARLRPWLVRVAWRLALDRIRSAKRRERREVAFAEPNHQSTAEEIVAFREFEGRLRAAMDELPEKLRLVVVLSAIEGYQTREVAGLLRVPEGTVKSRLFLARKRLAEKLKCFVSRTKTD